jgi:hypothetical protein
MGVSGGPNIVRDSSLVLELDAADRNSYVSNSLAWKDISGNNNSGSLVNGPTFSNNVIVFDGVDDYVNFSTNNLVVNTVSLWIYIKNGVNGAIIYSGSDLYNSGFWEWSIYIYNGTIYFRAKVDVNTAIYNASDYLNTWKNFTLIRNFNSKSYLYENGLYKTESAEFSSTNTNQLRLCKSGGNYSSINASKIQIYNRALSASEVLQNYNATKTRFGL